VNKLLAIFCPYSGILSQLFVFSMFSLISSLFYPIPIPDTQLKGPKGNGDMQAAKRD